MNVRKDWEKISQSLINVFYENNKSEIIYAKINVQSCVKIYLFFCEFGFHSHEDRHAKIISMLSRDIKNATIDVFSHKSLVKSTS